MPGSVAQVCIDYAPESGGTTTSVEQFHSVLRGPIIAFQRHGIRGGPTEPGVLELDCSGSLLGRGFARPDADRLRRAAEAVRDCRLLVCHMLYQFHVQWTVATAKRLGIPCWIVPHGSLDPYVFTYRSARKRAWLATVGRASLRRAQRVLFATEGERMKATRVLGAVPNAAVLRWPVAPVGAADRAAARRMLRERLQIPAETRVLLYVGRLHTMKRPIETMRAVSRVGPAVTLVMLGPDGDLSRSTLTELAAANGWANIRIVGPVFGAGKYDYLLGADGYISLSWRENFGHSVAEALSCGLPVILSDGVDLGRDLEGVGAGWIVDVEAAAQAEEAIAAFGSVDESELQRMGARGRSWAEVSLSPATFADALRGMARADIGA